MGISKPYETSKLLQAEQLELFIEYIVSNFDITIMQEIDKDKEFSRKILALYYEFIASTFFVESNLNNLSELYSTDKTFKYYIDLLVEKVSLLTTVQEIPYESLINTFMEGICKNKNESTGSSLINEQHKELIKIDEEYLNQILKDNFWILVIYTLLLFFDRTEFLIQSMKTSNS